MTRAQAVAVVARQLAALLSASTFDEALGMTADQVEALSPADAQRLSWAIDVVLQRLWKMGGK